eukprot:3758643-Amphidinium_carterae.1
MSNFLKLEELTDGVKDAITLNDLDPAPEEVHRESPPTFTPKELMQRTPSCNFFSNLLCSSRLVDRVLPAK